MFGQKININIQTKILKINSCLKYFLTSFVIDKCLNLYFMLPLPSGVSSHGKGVTVDFPQQSNWTGVVSEMEVVPSCHLNISCNGCHIFPLIGPRFRCKACDNFNYCETCFYTLKVHRHSFSRIFEPGMANAILNKLVFNDFCLTLLKTLQ